jgi:hypothetical protein
MIRFILSIFSLIFIHVIRLLEEGPVGRRHLLRGSPTGEAPGQTAGNWVLRFKKKAYGREGKNEIGD